MDPRLRLQHGFVADPTSHVLAGGAALQDLSPYSLNLLHSQLAARQDLAQARLQANATAAAAGLAPSLSSGQGFYTVESLQASTAPRPEDLARQSQWVGAGQQGYDAMALSRLLAQQAASSEGSVAVGQQGFDAVGLGHLLTQQAVNQRLIGGYVGSGLQGFDSETLNHLLVQQVASQRLGQQGFDAVGLGHLRAQQAARLGQNLSPLVGYSPYGQPDVSLASARLAMLAPQEAALLLRERERERERLKDRERDQERERYRDQDRERERHRERDRREDRDRERRKESDRRQRHDRRRDLEHETSTDKRDTDSLDKRDSRGVLLIRRLPDHLDETKSKDSQARDKEKTWCHLCQLLCTGQDMLQKHVAGKQHKLRVLAEEEAVALKKELAKSKNAQAKMDEKSSKVDKEKRAMIKEHVEKEKVKDTTKTKESNMTKGKSKSKANKRGKKVKPDKIESKSESNKTVSEDKPILTETGEESEKVQEGVLEKPILTKTGEDTEETEKVQGVLEQVELETGTTDKIEIEAMEVHSEGEDKNTHGTPALSAKKKDSASDIATQGEGIESVLGKRTLEVAGDHPLAAGDHPLAKKTRKPQGKGAVAAAGTVRCEVCKLTCRNAAVYETHLEGEKHAERLKKAQGQSSIQI